ncbi:MAG: M48 family metalloprotease [Thermoanaerobaculia bacterium]|nr:M48 family metalloprotease [Thermoanaerobaculia bacterium]
MSTMPESDAPGTEKPSSLNPFALSTETTSRFWMLTLTAVLLVWSLGSSFVETKNLFVIAYDVSPQLQKEIDGFIEEFQANGRILIGREELRASLANRPELNGILRESLKNLRRIAIASGITMATLVLAFLVFLSLPAWQRHRFRIRRLVPDESPKLSAEVAALAREIGLETPEIAVRPGLLDGLALRGTGGRPCLVLDGQPEWLERSWGDLNRAVALHELGHIANRDIWNRELARSTTFALCLALLVCLPVAIWMGCRTTELLSLERVGTIAVLWLLWAGLIRAREFYADSRVATAGYGDALAQRLQLVSPGSRWSLRSLWRMHPSNRARLEHLVAPERHFHVSRQLTLLTGVLAGIMSGHGAGGLHDGLWMAIAPVGLFAGMARNALAIVLGAVLAPLLILLAVVVVSYCISAALGVQILRSSVADLARESEAEWGYLKLIRFAVFFVIGVEVGYFLSTAGQGWRPTPSMMLFALLFTLVIWIWMIQTRALGRLALGAVTTRKAALAVERFLRVFASLQLALVLWPALIGRLAVVLSSRPDLVEKLSRSGHLDGEALAILQTSGFMFLAFGWAALALLGLVTHLGILLALGLHAAHCPSCGQQLDGWRAIGRRCAGCGSSLAPWLFLPTDRTSTTSSGAYP